MQWTKKCSDFRGIPTHRGWVKKIRFAPGKGNQKLLVMYADGAEVWDTKDVRITTPLIHWLVCFSTLQFHSVPHPTALRDIN